MDFQKLNSCIGGEIIMDFDQILKQWENSCNNNSSNKKSKKREDKSREDLTMKSLLEMYPPDEDSLNQYTPKPTERQKRRNYRRMKPQETLDLHGYTLMSAIIELEDFLNRCKKRRIEKILIIHGKGLHSPDGDSILRKGIIDKLKTLNFIGEIGHPSEKEGGAGATWAVLKY